MPQDKHSIEIQGPLSEEAEKNIIRNLLDFKFFAAHPQTQRQVALYPFIDAAKKNDLICKLMDVFWNDIPTPFKAFKDLDVFVSISKKRGHFTHQFEVFLLGLNLIRNLILKGRCKTTFKHNDLKYIFITWLMSATAHDFGRPIEVAADISNTLSDLYSNMKMKRLSKRYRRKDDNKLLSDEDALLKINLTSTSKTGTLKVLNIDSVIAESIKETLGISEAESLKIQDTLKKEDNHGYVSAIILCNILIEFWCKDSTYTAIRKKKKFKALKLAIGAIASHALSKSSVNKYVENISFNLNPYAYILFLMDNIQDWSRPVSHNDNWPTYTLNDFEFENNIFKLSYFLKHDKWKDKISNNVKKSIEEKNILLNLPENPKPELGITVSVSFEGNNGTQFENIELNI